MVLNAPEANEPVDDHVYQFDFQQGWIDLTLEKLDWVDAWAVATVVESTQFDSAKLAVKTRTLTRDLRKRALVLNGNESNLAAAYYTPEGRAVADFRLDTYSEEETPRPSPAEVAPLLSRISDAEVVGEPDVRYLDLAVGPAVRVRADVKNKRSRLGFSRGWTGGLIKYAVFPPRLDSLSVVSVRWWNPQDAAEATRLTDGLATTMKLVPADADEDEAERNTGS